MTDPAAAPAGRASRAPSRLPALSLRWDLALPLVLLAVQLIGAAIDGGVFRLFHPPHPLGALDWVLLAAGPVALAARRRHPVAVLWVNLAAALPWSSGSGWSHVSFIVAFFVAATAGKRYPAWLALAIDFAAIWLAPLIFDYADPSVIDALLLAGWLLALAIAAEAYRFRAERAAATRVNRQIEQRSHQSEERLRVARDLHDVIGHNISLINVQASMGLDLMDSQPEQARAALAAIKSVSKEALDELRTMLTTLRRDEDDVAPRSPAPGLDRLPELIELTRAAGLSVGLEVAGTAPALPAAVHLAAYRIIQESLTNVARHAGRARVTVRVTYRDADVYLEIDDDGAAPSGGASAIGTGSGIMGMRERAITLGGSLSAGFRHGGGFRVSARLPVRSAP
jgi:signal transduction histidine kinase